MTKENPNSDVQVYRRYSDFEWLIRALQFEDPTCFILPLPDKNIGVQNLKNEDDPDLKLRREGLQKFLEHAIKNNRLCENFSLEVFLVGLDPDFEKWRTRPESNEIRGLEKDLSEVLLDGSTFLAQLNISVNLGYAESAKKVG